ncbi:MAG: aryl-sulfate sulfotransferase [Planctomycetota bacterium]
MQARLAMLLLLAASPVAAQAPAAGFRLLGPYLSGDTLLVDTNGTVVHTWSASFAAAMGMYLDRDGSLVRPILTEFGAPAGAGGGVQRMAFDGTLLWDYRDSRPDLLPHHDIALLENGNVLMVAWQDVPAAEAIAQGRDPTLLVDPFFRPEAVVEVRPDGPTSGTIVWEWNLMDHVIQDFDPTKANFGVVSDHPELMDINFPQELAQGGEFNHVNGMDYDPVHDWIVLSAPVQNEVWVIDHSTTTAEAAGHTGGRWGKGGDLLYRWGNPAAYRAGTTADQQLFFQHNPRFIPPGYPGAGNLTVFNNRTLASSTVVELVLPLDVTGQFVLDPSGSYGPLVPVWSFTEPGFQSPIMSSAERLPNGNTLICSSTQRNVFEVSPAGQRVWDYTVSAPGSLPFQAHYVDRSMWVDTRTHSLAGGGIVTLDFVGGSDQAGNLYLLGGSASGTSPGLPLQGQVLPLNLDPYLVFTLSNPSVAPLGNSGGTLDANGRATATFSIPAGVYPPSWVGFELNHAFAVFDPTAGQISKTSNAEPVVFVQ